MRHTHYKYLGFLSLFVEIAYFITDDVFKISVWFIITVILFATSDILKAIKDSKDSHG